MMTFLKRLLLIVVLFVPMAITFFGLQVQTVRVHAQQAMPSGSCNDTVSDDAQLFGNRIVDVVNQAKAVNDSLQADTRVVTVGQNCGCPMDGTQFVLKAGTHPCTGRKKRVSGLNLRCRE